MERGELRALYVLGENPAQSEADATHADAAARGPRLPVVQDIFLTRTAEMADVVLPGGGELVRVRGHGHQQRAPRAARAQGARSARRGARRHRDPLRARRAAGPRLGRRRPPRRSGTSCARSRPMHARHELRAAGGAGRASSGPATTRTIPASRSCTAGCGRRPSEAPTAPFSVVEHEPPVDELTEEFPLRLTTGRRLDSYNTGVQTGGYTSPLRRGETLDISPEDCERLGVADGEGVRVSSRRGAVIAAGAHRPGAAPRPGLHDAALPRRGRDQHPDHRRDRPEVGHRRVQGRARSGSRSCASRRPSPLSGHVAIPAR